MNISGRRAKLAVLVSVVMAAALAAAALYWQSGPTERGLSQTASLSARVGAMLEKEPGDARAWVLQARRLAEAERFEESAQAYGKALALPSKVVKDPAVWCEYADVLAMMQRGKLAGKPRELIERALGLNPEHPKALELAGSAEYEQGNYAAALGYWRPLLAQMKPGSQMHGELAAAIARTEALAARLPRGD